MADSHAEFKCASTKIENRATRLGKLRTLANTCMLALNEIRTLSNKQARWQPRARARTRTKGRPSDSKGLACTWKDKHAPTQNTRKAQKDAAIVGKHKRTSEPRFPQSYLPRRSALLCRFQRRTCQGGYIHAPAHGTRVRFKFVGLELQRLNQAQRGKLKECWRVQAPNIAARVRVV
jgi:hypothetical protein